MPQGATSDWIKHDGAGMPVDGMTPVIPQFRADAGTAEAEMAAGSKGLSAHAYREFWIHAGLGCDIVAYRLVEA